jgi:hypothetical protein
MLAQDHIVLEKAPQPSFCASGARINLLAIVQHATYAIVVAYFAIVKVG